MVRNPLLGVVINSDRLNSIDTEAFNRTKSNTSEMRKHSLKEQEAEAICGASEISRSSTTKTKNFNANAFRAALNSD
jgi:hypothetical protein